MNGSVNQLSRLKLSKYIREYVYHSERDEAVSEASLNSEWLLSEIRLVTYLPYISRYELLSIN